MGLGNHQLPSNLLSYYIMMTRSLKSLVYSVLVLNAATAFQPSAYNRGHRIQLQLRMGKEIEVVSQPNEDFLKQKGVFDWGTWGCGVSKFPWHYDSTESAYVLEGKVTVIPDGGEAVTFGKGDFVTFPAGMSCTWDVHEPIQKHFMFF